MRASTLTACALLCASVAFVWSCERPTPAAQTTGPAGEQGGLTMEKATFAAGCFWGVEAAFRQIDGVTDAVAGYTGGTVDDPTYKMVCSDRTGHADRKGPHECHNLGPHPALLLMLEPLSLPELSLEGLAHPGLDDQGLRGFELLPEFSNSLVFSVKHRRPRPAC